MRQTSQNVKFIQGMVVLLVTGGLLFWIVIEKRRPPDASDLKIEVAGLHSYLSEATLIIDQAKADKITLNYFLAETSLLREKVEETLKKLSSMTPNPDLKEKFVQTAGLAGEGASELLKLSSSFEDRTAMDGIKAKLNALLAKASEIDRNLPQ